MLSQLPCAGIGKRLQNGRIPSISTGVYHFPLEKASEIAIKTISEYLFEHPEIERVRMVCFDERTKGFYEKALEKLK